MWMGCVSDPTGMLVSESAWTCVSAPRVPPPGFSAQVQSVTSILVEWNEIPDVDRKGIITAYRVQYWYLEDVLESVTISGAAMMTELTGLEENKNYTLRVQALTSAGPGPFSDLVVIQTHEMGEFLWRTVHGLYWAYLKDTINCGN